MQITHKAKATYFFIVQAVRRIILGWSVGKILIILSFSVSTSKSKNIDHQVKEACAIYVSTSYIWNQPHLFTPWFNNVKCTKFLFFSVFYCNLKEKYLIRRIMNSKNRNINAQNQYYYYYFDLLKIRVGKVHTTKN